MVVPSLSLSLSTSLSLFVRFFFVRRLWDAEGRAYARAEQESEASSRSKRISQGGYVGATGIREQKARGCAAIRGGGGGGGGGKIESESEKEGCGGGCRDGRVVGGGNGIIRNGEERE